MINFSDKCIFDNKKNTVNVCSRRMKKFTHRKQETIVHTCACFSCSEITTNICVVELRRTGRGDPRPSMHTIIAGM